MSVILFPDQTEFLKSEADKQEFIKLTQQAGLGAKDEEMAKLFAVLGIYKTMYADIPRQIGAVHNGALIRIEGLQNNIAAIADDVKREGARVGGWAERIQKSIDAVKCENVAEEVHRRLIEDALSALGGTLEVLKAAQIRIDEATAKMNAAAIQAETSIQEWQNVTLRRVWGSAFLTCGALAALAGFWTYRIFCGH